MAGYIPEGDNQIIIEHGSWYLVLFSEKYISADRFSLDCCSIPINSNICFGIYFILVPGMNCNGISDLYVKGERFLSGETDMFINVLLGCQR